MTCQKLFCPENVWFKKILVENDSAPKMFWVQRNLGFREVEKFGSFKKNSHRFLIKTNVGKILGAETFGPKQFGSRKKLSAKKCWSKKVWIQKNYGSIKFWVYKILAPKTILGPIFFKITDTDVEGGEHTRVAQTDTACTFKRGGRCIQHDCVGQKYVISSKVWTKNANGMFGYKTVKQTKYRCRFKGVPVTNGGKPGPKVRNRTTVTSSLGGETADYSVVNTAMSEACGRDYTGAGADKSESNFGRSDRQENG